MHVVNGKTPNDVKQRKEKQYRGVFDSFYLKHQNRSGEWYVMKVGEEHTVLPVFRASSACVTVSPWVLLAKDSQGYTSVAPPFLPVLADTPGLRQKGQPQKPLWWVKCCTSALAGESIASQNQAL